MTNLRIFALIVFTLLLSGGWILEHKYRNVDNKDYSFYHLYIYK